MAALRSNNRDYTMSQNDDRLDALTGSAHVPSHFDHLDMHYRLRMRAFVGLCMPSVFASLEAHLKMMSLRKRGYAAIMYYLDFTSGTTPLAFGRGVTNEHTLRLYRSSGDGANGGGIGRLFFCTRNVLKARARSHGPEALGFDDGSGELIEAGTAEILHVITRPLAPPGERQVAAVPEELRRLHEHRWQRPWPSPETLGVAPEGYARVDAGAAHERTDVWGLPNTDINQHVNVQEYVMGAENQFTRLLHVAGLPVARHHIARAQLVFRKPFFPGESYRVRAELWRRDERTRMHAGFYPDADGGGERPSAFVVFEGVIEDEA